jgi:carbonic anhydrase
MPTYKQIFENNKKWVAEKKGTDENFFENLSKGQDPDFLYIGCSDSRVTTEDLMGLDPGDVFVYRNIANLVNNNDMSAMSVIHFAVEHLRVKHIVVCGHYYCGGVKAAMQHKDLGILNPWLRNIRDVYRFHQDELSAIVNEDEKYKRLIELNVEEQCTNVLKTTSVQRAHLKSGYPKVHGWIFDIKTGLLIDLNFDYQQKLEEIREIYDLGRDD